jgi:hypothetical protein
VALYANIEIRGKTNLERVKMKASLQELKQMKPEDLLIENPPADPYWEQHLIWLLENHPQWTWTMFVGNKKGLKKALKRVVLRASLQELILIEEGKLDSDQIRESVNLIVAPPESLLLPPKMPLKDEQYMKVLSWSQNLS